MDRTHTLRPARIATSVLGVAGALTLAACSNGAGSTAANDAVASSNEYTDGTYTADGSYQTPRSTESISVTVTLADGTVSDVKVKGSPQAAESKQYQSQFISGISNEVVGKSIDSLKVTRVSGSSLTSGGFNEAIEKIKQEAQK